MRACCGVNGVRMESKPLTRCNEVGTKDNISPKKKKKKRVQCGISKRNMTNFSANTSHTLSEKPPMKAVTVTDVH